MAATRTAGVDWAAEAHEICISEEGQVAERFSATHDEEGIAALAARLAREDVARVAIERPDGILVERLLDAGLEVLAIHPNQVKAARPTSSPSLPAPMPTASGCWSRTPTRPRR